jgi:hypothetical protein
VMRRSVPRAGQVSDKPKQERTSADVDAMGGLFGEGNLRTSSLTPIADHRSGTDTLSDFWGQFIQGGQTGRSPSAPPTTWLVLRATKPLPSVPYPIDTVNSRIGCV